MERSAVEKLGNSSGVSLWPRVQSLARVLIRIGELVVDVLAILAQTHELFQAFAF